MQVEVSPQPRDYDALAALLLRDADESRLQRLKHAGRRSGIVLAALVVAVLLWGKGDRMTAAVEVIVAFLFLMAFYLFAVHFYDKRTSKRRVEKYVAEWTADPQPPRKYAVTDEGLAFWQDGSRDTLPWRSIADLVKTDECLYVFPSRQRPHILPTRDFESEAAFRQFLGLAREFWTRCTSAPKA